MPSPNCLLFFWVTQSKRENPYDKGSQGDFADNGLGASCEDEPC